MRGNPLPNQWALAYEIHSSENVLLLAGEEAEKLLKVVRQMGAFNAQGPQSFDEFCNRGLSNPAISMADNGYFLPFLQGAGQRQRTHRAAGRTGDNIAGIAQPDKLLLRNPEHIGHEWVQPRVDAGQDNDRQ